MKATINKTMLVSILIYLAIVIVLMLFLGFTYGTLFILGTWISLVMIYSLNHYVLNYTSGKRVKNLRKLALVGIVLFYSSFICIEALIISEWNSDTDGNVDYAVILGAGLDGDKVSNTVISRLDAGYDYLVKIKTSKVIVSGGRGQGETISEAEAMGQYLIYKGIDAERIIYEDKSTTTMQNLKFSNNIALSLSDKKPRFLIITSDYHMLRAKLLAQHLKLDYDGKSSISPILVRLNYSIREYFAIIKALSGTTFFKTT
ncbi:YdcF family protein [Dendrosporobacter sp. 1207_IL3150]|uniref:YdcF family protein n=1 Tax=Dendrosporobacter sp. 1207_IL3150 TaxID=3084054 RepID=UPI002FDA4ECD